MRYTSFRWSSFAALVIVSSFAASSAALAQSKTKSNSENIPSAKYKEARELIRHARTLLSDVVNDNPKSDDAYFARLQLAALENIFKTDVPIVPAALNERVTWRVLSVINRDSDTKITLEIENRSDAQEARFGDFNSYPLAIVANKKVYAMKKGEVKQPQGVQTEYHVWKLQPTQAITVDLYFDALDEGVLDGIVKYAATDMNEKPARFSLMNVNQVSAQ